MSEDIQPWQDEDIGFLLYSMRYDLFRMWKERDLKGGRGRINNSKDVVNLNEYDFEFIVALIVNVAKCCKREK